MTNRFTRTNLLHSRSLVVVESDKRSEGSYMISSLSTSCVSPSASFDETCTMNVNSLELAGQIDTDLRVHEVHLLGLGRVVLEKRVDEAVEKLETVPSIDRYIRITLFIGVVNSLTEVVNDVLGKDIDDTTEITDHLIVRTPQLDINRVPGSMDVDIVEKNLPCQLDCNYPVGNDCRNKILEANGHHPTLFLPVNVDPLVDRAKINVGDKGMEMEIHENRLDKEGRHLPLSENVDLPIVYPTRAASSLSSGRGP